MKLQFKNWLNETGTVGGNQAQSIKPGAVKNLNLNAIMGGLAQALGINKDQSGGDAAVAKLKQDLPKIIEPAVKSAMEKAKEEEEKRKQFLTNKPQPQTPPPPQAPKIPTPAVPAARAPAMGARGK
jgi:hypothetical protein